MALGVVYMTVDGTNRKYWNDDLEERLSGDKHTLRGEGKSITLLGDFNGHIRADDRGCAIRG